MTSLTGAPGAPRSRPSAHTRGGVVPALSWRWAVFWAGVLSLLGPTLWGDAQQSWAGEQGQQGPLVLALGLWLLWREWQAMRAVGRPGLVWTSATGIGVAACLYVLGRLSDQILIESYALYGLGVMGVYALLGGAGLRRGWFPLAYLILALPLPYTLVWILTAHLRLWVTEAAVQVGQALGLSIVRDGLNILVDQYELAVQQACSGMNSLFSLSAIGLLYLKLRRSPPWWYIALMLGPIIVFALFGNLVRILCLIAMTHFWGDEVAQSFLHETAGLITFAVALGCVVALDAALGRRVGPGRPAR